MYLVMDMILRGPLELSIDRWLRHLCSARSGGQSYP